MIRMPSAIQDLPCKMLLQVHDELLFEVSGGAEEKVIDTARDVMEQAARPALHLDVPLVVDAGQGNNWAEAH
ncbi:MAG: DNA polymerase, partial [Nitratireductor sp.]